MTTRSSDHGDIWAVWIECAVSQHFDRDTEKHETEFHCLHADAPREKSGAGRENYEGRLHEANLTVSRGPISTIQLDGKATVQMGWKAIGDERAEMLVVSPGHGEGGDRYLACDVRGGVLSCKTRSL